MIAFRIPGLWFLGFIALTPFLFVLQGALSKRTLFFLGISIGASVVGAGSWWILSVDPNAFLIDDTQQALAVLLIFFNWLWIIISTAPVVGLWALIASRIAMSGIAYVTAFSFLWVVFEYVRMITFNIANSAVEIHNPLFFSPGFLGYLLADNTSWLQLSSIGGLPLLSFLVIFVNGMFFLFLKEKKNAYKKIGMLIIILSTISFLPTADLRASFDTREVVTKRVGIFSLNLPIQEGVNAHHDRSEVISMVQNAVEDDANIILLSEDIRLFAPFSKVPISGEVARSKTVVIDSGPVRRSFAENEKVRVLAVAHSDKGMQQLYERHILTPQGEFVPIVWRVILNFFAPSFTESFLFSRGYQHGSLSASFTNDHLKGSLIFCSEILKPGLVRKVVKEQDSNIIFVPASHSWFRGSKALEEDIRRAAHIQTVHAKVFFVRSVNQGNAYILSPYGQELARVNNNGVNQYQVFSVDIPIGKN